MMNPPDLSGAQWLTIAVSVLGTVGTLGSIWLTSHFAERRQKRERLWDLKREAYAALIEAFEENLHHQRRLARLDWDDEAIHERVKQMAAEVKADRDKLRGVRSRYTFLLSEAGQQAIRKHQQVVAELEAAVDGPEKDYKAYMQRSVTSFADTVQRLTEAADRELK